MSDVMNVRGAEAIAWQGVLDALRAYVGTDLQAWRLANLREFEGEAGTWDYVSEVARDVSLALDDMLNEVSA